MGGRTATEAEIVALEREEDRMMEMTELHVRVSESVDIHVETHYDPVNEDIETYVILKMGNETLIRLDWNEWLLLVGFAEAAHDFEH